MEISVAWLLLALLTPSLTAYLLPADTCDVPNWTVQGIRVTYSDDTYTPGLASFNVTNSITHNVESLKCELSFNTRCEIRGTPLDNALSITFLVNMGTAVIRFNQAWTCGNVPADPALCVLVFARCQSDQCGVLTQSSPSFVLASAELEVSCPEVITETMTCTALLDSSLLVNGSIVTPVPEPPNVEERLKI